LRRFGRIFLIVSAVLSLVGCHKDNIVEVPERLRSVTLLSSAVILPFEGTGEFDFRVQDSSFKFNYDVSSPTCQVRLQLSDGTAPLTFHLVRVLKTEEEGVYTAVVADNGFVEQYSESACIVIVQKGESGAESFITSGSISIRSEAEEYSVIVKTGLPVVYIDTENAKAVNSKTVDVPAVLKVKGCGEYADQKQMGCFIRGRGNTTWSWPKKPYLVKLDKRTSMLGMPEHKRWVLLANFMDRTLMRNLVSMKVSSLTSLAWTPRCVPVELVLNGKHLGSYLLIEQVRVDENRVNISDTSGYLLESDFHYDNEFQWKDHGIPFAVKYPDADDLSQTHKTFIKDYISKTSKAIYGSSFADPENGYAAWIDVDSFVDYWLVFEVMGNHELGNPGSVFFHKDVGGKLVAGPCWDFDWGVLSYNTSPHARTGFVNRKAIWYERLFKDPVFATKVRERFQELLPELERIPDYMEECRTLLSKSAELNFAMWDPSQDRSMNGGKIINGDENMTFDAAVDRLKDIYHDRLEILNQQL